MIVMPQNPLAACTPEWQLFTEDKTPVSTFRPSVLSCVKFISSTDEAGIKNNPDKDNNDAARVQLRFKDGDSTETIVSLADLDRVNWFKIDRRCLVNAEYREANRYIAKIICVGIGKAPEERRYVLGRPGIYHIENTVVFAAGDRVITRSLAKETAPNFELGQLQFRLDIDKNLTAAESFEGMKRLINLSPEIGSILMAHVISGIIRAAFKEAGFTPCAVLVVVGRSGMLKSHYVPHLAQLYNRTDGIGAVTRFNSTKRFIEDALYEYSECTAVIDDLHTAESRGIRKRNEDTAEEIIRRISDDTGRGRMEGNTQVQRHFRGNAVFIGEYTIGRASTIPRALVVNLTAPPNGAVLDYYQRHQPLLVSTFYYYFIQWYVDHFDEIRNEIDARLTKLRAASASSAVHGRLRDTQFYLQISYLIFLEFCKDSGFCSKKDALDTYNGFIAHLAKLVHAQETRFRKSIEAEAINYLSLIGSLYRQGYFRVAKGTEDFNPDKHDGLIHYECLCLRGKCLEKKLRYIQSDFNLDACLCNLLSQNALRRVGSKNTVQINGTGGKRFYAIWLKKLR